MTVAIILFINMVQIEPLYFSPPNNPLLNAYFSEYLSPFKTNSLFEIMDLLDSINLFCFYDTNYFE